MKGMNKHNMLKIIRWGLLVSAILFIILCRYSPVLAEGYARNIYPAVSITLSAFSSFFPFSLEEILVVIFVLWMILFPILKRRKGKKWKYILFRETEALAWIYVWFYFGWGLNYFRYNIYTRLQVKPAVYEEQAFIDFLTDYTTCLNAAYLPQAALSLETIEKEVKEFYVSLPDDAGLVAPESFQKPKFFAFTPLYSGVGVLGSMGPFFAEAQLNADLLPVQLPFTYAHEFSHLLGVSNEAEANYWAFRACTESTSPTMQYCGYFGLFPYVLSNAASLLFEEQFKEWVSGVRPEIIASFNENRRYWKERYSPVIGEIQDVAYNLFLKGNNIPSGQKNYAEVIGILLSLQPKKDVGMRSAHPHEE